MGAVFDSGDVARNRREMFQNAIKDISPETRDKIVKIFEEWKGRASEKELEGMIGSEKAKKIRELANNLTDELSTSEVDNLRRMFRDSVTFD